MLIFVTSMSVSLSVHVTFKVDDHRCIMDSIRVSVAFLPTASRYQKYFRRNFIARFHVNVFSGGWRCKSSAEASALVSHDLEAGFVDSVRKRLSSSSRLDFYPSEYTSCSLIRDQRFLISGFYFVGIGAVAEPSFPKEKKIHATRV